MKKNYRNPMTRPENFMNPAGNVMKEIKEADLNNFSAGAGEPRVSDGSQFCTSTVNTDQTEHTARRFSAWLPPIQCTLSGHQCMLIIQV